MSEASEDTRVQIKGTFSVKKRENNGLNKVAEHMNQDRLARVPIVGYVEFVRHVDTRDGDEMTVELVVVEPAVAADGTDPYGYGAQVKQIIEAQRKSAGKAAVADTLFTGEQTKTLDAELDGQIEAVTPTGELNASGDPVPEKSGEEVMAERAEARAQATADDGKRKNAAARRPDLVKATAAPLDVVKAVTGTTDMVKPGWLAGTPDPAPEPAEKPADGAARPARAPRKATVRPATASPFDTPKEAS